MLSKDVRLLRFKAKRFDYAHGRRKRQAETVELADVVQFQRSAFDDLMEYTLAIVIVYSLLV